MTLTVINLDTPTLGDRSYIAHDGKTALAVDPQRDIDRVQAILDREGLTLGGVVETHMHNDYVSGGLVLAQEHGAKYIVSEMDPVTFERVTVADKQIETIGDFAVQCNPYSGTYLHTHVICTSRWCTKSSWRIHRRLDAAWFNWSSRPAWLGQGSRTCRTATRFPKSLGRNA
jgi:hypothetical protein